MSNYKIFPLFIPFSGCKNRCIFCDQNIITNNKSTTEKNLLLEISNNLLKLDRQVDEIAIYGGSFTGLDFKTQEQILATIRNNKFTDTAKIRISTYPEFINEEILLLLKKYNVSIVELGAQILDNDILTKIGRNYTISQVFKASELIKQSGCKLGLQIMLGLPTATEEIEYETINKIIKISPDFLRIYPCMILEKTELHFWFLQNKYKPLSLDDIINRCVNIMVMLESTNIKIIRIGLHSDVKTLLPKIVNKNSYHSALGELVKSEYIKKKIEKHISFENLNSDNLTANHYQKLLLFPQKFYSQIIGIKKMQLEFYKKNNIEFKIINSINNIKLLFLSTSMIDDKIKEFVIL